MIEEGSFLDTTILPVEMWLHVISIGEGHPIFFRLLSTNRHLRSVVLNFLPRNVLISASIDHRHPLLFLLPVVWDEWLEQIISRDRVDLLRKIDLFSSCPHERIRRLMQTCLVDNSDECLYFLWHQIESCHSCFRDKGIGFKRVLLDMMIEMRQL